ncbi:nuclear factor 7, brain [Amia ocellicauda]|uniref:nuclear factor 7, brain n=1 Tax=Amia ocellicauda TaxID=2972642 RepID=UPI003463959D
MATSIDVRNAECPICLELFTDLVTLSCSHSFCQGCLERYMKPHEAVQVCPECRNPVGEMNFHTNKLLRNMLRKAREQERKKPLVSEASSRTGEREYSNCPEHNERIKLYCKTDRQLMCWVCREGKKHQGHSFTLVEEAAQEYQNALRANQRDMMAELKDKECLKAMQEEQIISRKEKSVQLETQISAQFQKLQELLRQGEEALKREVQGAERSDLNPMERNLAMIEREMKEGSERASMMKIGLKISEPDAFLQWWIKTGFTALQKKISLPLKSHVVPLISDSLTVGPSESLEKYVNWTSLENSALKDIREGKSSSHDSGLSIVLLGQTGTGKSAAGNTILRRTEFKSALSSQPVTTKCERKEAVIDGRHVAVIDTPDFFDQDCPDPETQIKNCMSLSVHEPHAFLLVIKLGYFAQGKNTTIRYIQEVFGQEATEHMLVLFTHGDELTNQSIQQFLQKTQVYQALIKQCGGRYHLFNNRDTKNHRQAKELLEKIDRMMAVQKK